MASYFLLETAQRDIWKQYGDITTGLAVNNLRMTKLQNCTTGSTC